jgi:hypothetical protein
VACLARTACSRTDFDPTMRIERSPTSTASISDLR